MRNHSIFSASLALCMGFLLLVNQSHAAENWKGLISSQYPIGFEISPKPNSQAVKALWEFMGKALPTASAISLTLMMILCSMSGLFTPLPTILENENTEFKSII